MTTPRPIAGWRRVEAPFRAPVEGQRMLGVRRVRDPGGTRKGCGHSSFVVLLMAWHAGCGAALPRAIIGASSTGRGRVPKIYEERGYEFRFFASDGAERPHVHVRGQGGAAKVWLNPVRFAWQRGFNPHQLHELEGIVRDHERDFMERWHGFFG
jgi:Domain of unknown function (DUF4160)